MTGEGQDFRVNPDELDALADRIERLGEEVSGTGGNFNGSYDRFTTEANDGVFLGVWQSIVDDAGPSNPPVNAYKAQYTGMSNKYAGIKDQLAQLAIACRSTAAEYRQRDQDTTDAVRHHDATSQPGEAGL